MSPDDRPPVERVQPAKRPYVLINVVRRLLSSQTVADIDGALIAEAGHEKAGRRMGIRITVDRNPTHDQLVDAARRDGLSLVHLVVSDVAVS